MKQYERTPVIRCPECNRLFKEQEVKCINVSEDMQGIDVITFICPNCTKTETSYVYQ